MNLEMMRKKASMTQVDVANVLGVAQNTVSMWENGVNKVRAEMIPKLAKLYGCSIEELYGEEEQ